MGKMGICLEVFNAIGEPIAVLVVAESQIEPLMRNEVLHIRVLDKAGYEGAVLNFIHCHKLREEL